MKQFEINGIKLEIDQASVSTYLSKIKYPIAIVDFETFRTFQKTNFSAQVRKDFLEKIFSVAVLIVESSEDLLIDNLTKKKKHLFYKTELPKKKKVTNFDILLEFQSIFLNFLIEKLLRYNVSSLVFLGGKTEVSILKNYLIYFFSEKQYKEKISYFFQSSNIFDIYDLWNNDTIVNLPQFKSDISSINKIGATKKTLCLIKNDNRYLNFLKPDSVISNNDIGRIIDQYFSNKIVLLDNFLVYVADHNQNDVLVGAAILSFLYLYVEVK